MKILIAFLAAFLAAVFRFFFKSNLQPMMFSTPSGNGYSDFNSQELLTINPFPNGRYTFHGRANGSSKRRKTNRLHLSTKTRNKHR